MQGKVFQGRDRLLLVGITPAYAGKSFADDPHKRA